jgi:sterol desaturase/sphingolipid hydroxylase (fatty acid hydroxylase superfamily)
MAADWRSRRGRSAGNRPVEEAMVKDLLGGESAQIIGRMMTDPNAPGLLRAAIFVGLLLLLGALEPRWPVRLSDPQRPLRWTSNFALVLLGSVIILALQLSLLGVALGAQRAGFGLFNQVSAPAWVEIGLALLLLDLAIYAQHRAFHEWRWLWPLHRVHHSDVEFDVTTGLRFHPGELLLSQLYKAAVVALIGAPWLAVLLFEIALSSFALITHANLRLHPRLEAILRSLLVTPDMHRTHHSTHRDEHDANYGNVLSLWDRLFRSHVPASREPHRSMRIGLPEFRVPAHQHLPALLMQPLKP